VPWLSYEGVFFDLCAVDAGLCPATAASEPTCCRHSEAANQIDPARVVTVDGIRRPARSIDAEPIGRGNQVRILSETPGGLVVTAAPPML
jgi:hypothetical protein